MRDASGMTIGQVAARAGVRASAIRYYESVGVLPPARRVHGWRRYDDGAVRLLATLRFAQRAGFTVAEIRTLFHGFGAEVPPAARWHSLAERKMAELDALMADAARMRRALEQGMRCGCLHLEDCEVDAERGCAASAVGCGSERERVVDRVAEQNGSMRRATS